MQKKMIFVTKEKLHIGLVNNLPFLRYFLFRSCTSAGSARTCVCSPSGKKNSLNFLKVLH